ncbi:acyl-CoA synthetase [Microbacterium sp. RD1]|uniref:acyl-CoA synthetase n=1 Tax=Microbacterium sp. RD1 TaxID=3457313 RepID=UPI003FA53554
MTASPARAFELHHLQLARALFAAIAAIMVTFSPDHSAAVGLAVFSGFAIATGFVFALAAWLISPAGHRAPAVLLAFLSLAAGMVAGIAPWRGTAMLFIVLVAWAVTTGVVEIVVGARGRRDGVTSSLGSPRDLLTTGIVTLVLAVGVLLVQPGYALQYYVDEAAQSFTLTGTTIAVGIFGGYAAVLAVFLGIAGFSPRRSDGRASDADAASTAGQKGVGA